MTYTIDKTETFQSDPVRLSGEYVVVSSGDWQSFREVARDRGIDFSYSIEDAEDGVEYHIHSNLDEAEDILWAIRMVARGRSDKPSHQHAISMQEVGKHA